MTQTCSVLVELRRHRIWHIRVETSPAHTGERLGSYQPPERHVYIRGKDRC